MDNCLIWYIIVYIHIHVYIYIYTGIISILYTYVCVCMSITNNHLARFGARKKRMHSLFRQRSLFDNPFNCYETRRALEFQTQCRDAWWKTPPRRRPPHSPHNARGANRRRTRQRAASCQDCWETVEFKERGAGQSGRVGQVCSSFVVMLIMICLNHNGTIIIKLLKICFRGVRLCSSFNHIFSSHTSQL